MSVLSVLSAGRPRAVLALAAALIAGTPSAAAAAPLAAVSPAAGTIEVFGRDPATGQLRETAFDQATGRWSPWTLRGGVLASGTDLAAAARADGRSIDVFFLNAAGLIQRLTFDGTAWSRAITLSPRPASDGPAVVTGRAGIQVFARDKRSGNLIRHVWNPATGAVKTSPSTIALAANTGPAVDSADGKVAQIAFVPARSSRPSVASLSLSATTLGAVASKRRPRGPSVQGSPSITALADRSFVLTGRGKGGTLTRLASTRNASTWPASYQTIVAPPAGTASADPAATVAYAQTPGATENLLTFLPGTNGRDLLEFVPRMGWFTVTPPAPTLSERIPAPVAAPAAATPATPSPPVSPQPAGQDPAPAAPTAPPAPVVPPGPSANGPEPLQAGTIRYFGRTSANATWNAWLNPSDTLFANRLWLTSKAWRLEMFSPFGNGATSWFPGGMVYYPLYTIDPADAQAHPDWVLRDGDGNWLYAADGSDPHVSIAGNIFNADYRRYQINRLLAVVGSGAYRGLWLDNVNLEMGDSGLVERTGSATNHIGFLSGADDSAAGGYVNKALAPDGTFPGGWSCDRGTIPSSQTREVSEACWSTGIANMVREVRQALPADKELLTNTPWFQFERNVNRYQFIDDESGQNAGRPTGGLPTAPGQSVVASSTYADFEGGFWSNAQTSGYGPGGASDVAGHSDAEYSADGIMRWIDALHAPRKNADGADVPGKGVIVDYDVAGDLSRMSQTAASNAETPLRINEYNLAGELLVSTGRDGIGIYNQTDQTWPTITGTGGTNLFDMDLGSAASLPAGVTQAGAGSTGRGVVKVGSAENRLWIRRFVRSDGRHVFVLLSEPGTGLPDRYGGDPVAYTVPSTGCSDMTRAANAQPTYRKLTGSTVTLYPRAAALLLCN